MSIKKLINEILTKQIIPTAIYKRDVNNLFTIEVANDTTNTYITFIYKTLEARDKDFNTLDNKTFWYLPFNPYNTPIPGPPL